MADNRRRPRSVDGYEHYYAVSVAFTKGHMVRLALTEFHFHPRALTSTDLGWQEAQMYSTNAAVQWLQYGVEKAGHVLVPEWRPGSGDRQLGLW